MPDTSTFAIDEATERRLEQLRLGIPCRGCDARLPIRLASEGEDPALWVCTDCGARIAGLLLGVDLPRVLAVRMANVHFDDGNLTEIPEIFWQLVRHFSDSGSEFKGPKRRRAAVVERRLELLIVPLDDRFSPSGSSLRAVLCSISATKAELLSTAPTNSSNLAMLHRHAAGGGSQLFGRITGMQPLIGQFHNIQVEMRHRLGGETTSLDLPGRGWPH